MILAAVDDLLFASKIRGAAKTAGREIDGGAIKLVAFVRHTSAERIAAAREAGIDVVLARSAFFPALAGMLAGRADES